MSLLTNHASSNRTFVHLRAFAILVAGAALLAVCSPPAGQGADDEEAIRALDREMVAALNARDVERYMSCLAEEATWMPPGRPLVEGKAAIRELVSALTTTPDFSVAHHPVRVEVARSGDLAALTYTYEFTVTDATGRSTTETGADLTILRKTDGAWQVILDIWNS